MFDENWQKSPSTLVYRYVCQRLDSVRGLVRDSTIANPYLQAKFDRVLCHEFVYWRCGREAAPVDINEFAIVWETMSSRQLGKFGGCRLVNIPEFGSLPVQEEVRESHEDPEIFSALKNDYFWQAVIPGCPLHVGQILFGRVIMKKLVEQRMRGGAFAFERRELNRQVLSYEVVPGVCLNNFFETKRKAETFGENTMKLLKVTGKSLSMENRDIERVMDKWHIVFMNSCHPTIAFNFVKDPQGKPVPDIHII